MDPTVYLETSFFSFLFDERVTPAIVARHQWTQKWWDLRRRRYVLATSAAVIAELEKGSLPHAPKALECALQIPALPDEEDIDEIVGFYRTHRLMPTDPAGDALHLALASFHKLDFLVTWNCQNLANANKYGHIRRVNSILGLHVPALVTPLELLGEDADDSNA